MTIEKLAQLAEQNGWDLLNLQSLFDIPTDRVVSKTTEGLIKQAIEEGDDLEWIEEMVSKPAHF